jgi:tetratricopeptide (TPR) repeat protein
VSKLAPLMAILLVALAGFALWPGASGGFIFDDYVNLPALGEFGRIDNLHALAYYLTAGLGDPLGRPLSQLTFLIDARDWPASPAPFLRTNIVLHLINTALLVGVLVRLARAHGMDASRARSSALVGAGIWALHPLFLSTTLYIVQRESMLAALFVLLGFLAWLHGRALIERGRTKTGLAFMAIGSLGCTLLAALCKANGAMLPLLLLFAEQTVLPPPQGAAASTLIRARRLFIYAPSVLLVAALVAMIPMSIDVARAHRPWTLGERLLTEPRVIVDYLGALLTPRPVTRGVFHDDFVVSTDLLHPWTTLPAMALIVALAAFAWTGRRRWPLVSFAILFFLGGHLLEGSVIALELYFEHRNYLPAMPIFWPLAVWLVSPGAGERLRRVAAVLVIAMLAFDTRLGASVWGQPERLALTWAAYNPDSPRAQTVAAQYEMRRGDVIAARARLTEALARHPDEAQIAFNLADADCALGGLTPATLEALPRALHESANSARLGFGWLSNAVARAKSGACAGLDLDVVETLLNAIRTNPRFAEARGRQQDFAYIDGLIALARNDAGSARAAFDRGLMLAPNAEAALKQAAQLAGADRPDLALEHLRLIECVDRPAPRPWPTMVNVRAWLLHRWGYWENEVAELERRLVEDVHAMHDAPDATSGEISPKPCPAPPPARPA